MDTSNAPRSAGGTDVAFATAETHPPDVSPDQAASIAERVFGITGLITELGSQRDRNFRIDAADGRYVLKVANPAVPEIWLESQNAAMEHLGRAGLPVPRPQPARGGATLEHTRVGDADLAVRLLTFLDGTPLSSFGYLAPAVRGRMGRLAAEACRAFADFDAPGLHRRLEWTCATARRSWRRSRRTWPIRPAASACSPSQPLPASDWRGPRPTCGSRRSTAT